MEYIACIGKYTLPVYILQYYVFLCISSLQINHLDSMNYFISHFLLFPAISFLLLIILSIIAKLSMRYKFAGRILWGY